MALFVGGKDTVQHTTSELDLLDPICFYLNWLDDENKTRK
jgi:hypothetical protein